MSGNPLEDDPERERLIRTRAYHLWNDEGCPHGRDAEFWERARELVAMEESAGAGRLANPMTTGQDPSAAEPVEEAFLQDNLGEFPDRFADQGEVEPTPHAHRAPGHRAPGAQAPEDAQTQAADRLPGKPSLKAKAVAQAKAPARRSKPKR